MKTEMRWPYGALNHRGRGVRALVVYEQPDGSAFEVCGFVRLSWAQDVVEVRRAPRGRRWSYLCPTSKVYALTEVGAGVIGFDPRPLGEVEA